MCTYIIRVYCISLCIHIAYNSSYFILILYHNMYAILIHTLHVTLYRYSNLLPRPRRDHLDHQAVQREQGVLDAGALRTALDTGIV